jgi:hypothetical protein
MTDGSVVDPFPRSTSTPCKFGNDENSSGLFGSSTDKNEPIGTNNDQNEVNGSAWSDIQTTGGSNFGGGVFGPGGAPLSILEAYINQLRGYFNGVSGSGVSGSGVNGFSMIRTDAQERDALNEVLREFGLSPRLGDSAQLTPSQGENGVSGEEGSTSDQERHLEDVSSFSESPATGFMPPQSGPSSPGFVQSLLELLRRLVGI